MEWEQLPPEVLEDMEMLGAFEPTRSRREIKGCLYDPICGGTESAYLDSDCLRRLAASMVCVADWLDKRAAKERKE